MPDDSGGRIDFEPPERPFPEHLTAKWDALPKSAYPMIVGPWNKRNKKDFNHRTQTAVGVRALRHNGFTLDEVLAIALWAVEGLGRLSTYHELIVELWEELGKEEREKAETEAIRAKLSAVGWMNRAFPPTEKLLGDVLTTKGRMFLVGYTGLGKTMLGMGMAVGMATQTGFLDWQTSRPLRVLYVDGEMSRELTQERIRDAVRRAGCSPPSTLFTYCADDAEALAEEFPQLGLLAPLNTEHGQQFIYDLITALGGLDVIIFDNVMSLIVGDHKDEAAWSDTLPLVAGLTRMGIAQVWFDHTGHNAAQQYGTSTKAWRFDSVGIMTRLNEADPRETAFSLSFDFPGKARRRTPDNWQQFAPRVIRLRDDKWTSEAVGNVSAGGEAKLADKPAILLRTLRNLEPELFEDIHPEPQMPLCKAVRRSKLRSKLIAEGWFPETAITDAALSGFEKLKPTKAGYSMENNALSPLKRRGFINFNRDWIWLVSEKL
jgi:hypothetical protein